jgi:hypothetical protein
MKHLWANEELIGHFTLSPAELKLLANKTNLSKLGLAIFLKLFQYEGRFPTRRAKFRGLLSNSSRIRLMCLSVLLKSTSGKDG